MGLGGCLRRKIEEKRREQGCLYLAKRKSKKNRRKIEELRKEKSTKRYHSKNQSPEIWLC